MKNIDIVPYDKIGKNRACVLLNPEFCEKISQMKEPSKCNVSVNPTPPVLQKTNENGLNTKSKVPRIDDEIGKDKKTTKDADSNSSDVPIRRNAAQDYKYQWPKWNPKRRNPEEDQKGIAIIEKQFMRMAEDIHKKTEKNLPRRPNASAGELFTGATTTCQTRTQKVEELRKEEKTANSSLSDLWDSMSKKYQSF